MAEDNPELVFEERGGPFQPMGFVTTGDGKRFPVFARLAFGTDKTILVDLGRLFVQALHQRPELIAPTADQLAAILRDAIQREGVAGVVA